MSGGSRVDQRADAGTASSRDVVADWRSRATRVLPGGVSTNVRLLDGPDVFIVERAHGHRVWDVAGTEYIDYVCGFGAILLGHGHAGVMEAVQAALTRGQQFGATHPLEIRLAEELCVLIPSLEMVRFSNSGSEAVHAAVRLARAATGRRIVVKFEGHYHGWLDGVLVSTHPARPHAARGAEVPGTIDSRGVPPQVLDDVLIAPWNDLDAVRRVMATRGNDVAAIIMEPIMCNDGCIGPDPGFLEAIRTLCDEHGSVMILDEVITGFRVGVGGAQGMYGVRPDVSIFGKALGSGFPISVVGGSRDLMRRFGDGTVNHSGTFNGNAVAVAAAVATLSALRDGGPALYADLQRRGRTLIEGLNDAGRSAGVPVHAQGPGPVFWMWIFSQGVPPDVRRDGRLARLADAAGADAVAYATFRAMMQQRGIRLMPGGRWYVSCAHDDAVIDRTIRAARESLAAMR
jgi:glutamate-1-semialdehyde 2,1-aminomutase